MPISMRLGLGYHMPYKFTSENTILAMDIHMVKDEDICEDVVQDTGSTGKPPHPVSRVSPAPLET